MRTMRTRAVAGVVSLLAATSLLASASSDVGAAASYDTSNPFGNQVAVSGRRAVLGVPSFAASTGIVYQYLLGDSWKQMAKISVSGGGPDDSFGAAVAYTGNGLIVGAPGRNQGNGAVYTIIHVNGIWGQSGSVTDPSVGDQSQFGAALAVGGGRIVIGAPGLDIAGMVHVARTVGGTLQVTSSLVPSTRAADDDFGQAVAIQNGTILVGAPGSNSGSGAAYLFKLVHGTYTQVRSFVEANPVPGDHFGASVAFTDTGVAIGAPGKTIDGRSGAGAVEVYEQQTSTTPTTLHATTPEDHAGFGKSISAFGPALAIGAPRDGAGSGSAVVATHGKGTWTISSPVVGSAGEHLGWSVGISAHTVNGPHHTHLQRIIPVAATEQFLGTLGR